MKKFRKKLIAIITLFSTVSFYNSYISNAVEINIDNKIENTITPDYLQINNCSKQKENLINENTFAEEQKNETSKSENAIKNEDADVEKITLEQEIQNVLAPQKSETIVLTEHSAYSHTKDEIIQKYKDSQPINSNSTFYDETPNYTEPPYSEGKLNDGLVQDTLKLINYYRWLSGLNEVTLNNEWMTKSQRGALLMKINDVFSHQQPKPEGVEESIYSDGAQACESSNIAWTNSENGDLLGTVLLYINDEKNVEPNVGHRTHLFHPKGETTSMGQCYNYSTIHVEPKLDSDVNKDEFYSWPVPGYQEATGFAKNAKWSVTLNSNKYEVKNVEDLKVTISVDGIDYKATPQFDGNSTVFYDLPDELKENLCQNQEYIIDGKKAKIRIDGIGKDNDNINNVSIEYNTEFFYQEKILTKDIQIFNTDNIDEMKGYYINKNATIYVNDDKRSTYILPFFLPKDATDRRIDIEIVDDSIISMEDITSQIEGDYGAKIYKITGKNIGTTNIKMTRVADGKEIATYTVESTVKEIQNDENISLGDVNADGKINVIDCTAILKHIKGTKLLTDDEKTRADVNKDNKVNVIDCTAILKHIKGTKLIDQS